MSGTAATVRLAFKPTHKLRTAAEFDRVRTAGRRVGNALFGLHYLPNDCGHARLGMGVSLRVAGSAVRRNRIRRCVRESFRLHQHLLPPVDLFVSARGAARGATGAEMFMSLERLWGQLGKP